MINKNGRLISY